MKADVREWLMNNYNGEYNDYSFDDMVERFYDDIWDKDEVTGNGGDWYDSEYKCEEYVCHNLDLLIEALFEFGELEARLVNIVKKHSAEGNLARWADCAIRCRLLYECIYEVLKELGYDARPQEN